MTAHPTGDPLGLLEPSLDVPGDDGLGPLPGTDERRSRRWRGLLVWSATSAPVALLLTAGIAFGPQGINLLSPATLTLLDPVVPVALAAFGVLVGLSVNDRRTDDARMLAAACLAAAVTVLVVSAGFGVVALTAMSSIAGPFWILILTGGICAATSLTLPSGDSLEPQVAGHPGHRTRRPASDRGGWADAGVAPCRFFRRRWCPCRARVRRHPGSGRCCMVAVDAGLFRNGRTRVRRVGTAARRRRRRRAVPVRAIRRTGRRRLLAICGAAPAQTISRDVLFVQHPLLVLVLLVAGARADLSPSTLALGVGYVVLRVAGQVAAGTLRDVSPVGASFVISGSTFSRPACSAWGSR